MTQKYTTLPALPFIFQHWKDTYAVVAINADGNTTLVGLNDNGYEKTGHVYEDNIPASNVLVYLNNGSYTLISPAPQQAVPEMPVETTPVLGPLAIRIDTTEVERALGILTELEASVTRVKALFA